MSSNDVKMIIQENVLNNFFLQKNGKKEFLSLRTRNIIQKQTKNKNEKIKKINCALIISINL